MTGNSSLSLAQYIADKKRDGASLHDRIVCYETGTLEANASIALGPVMNVIQQCLESDKAMLVAMDKQIANMEVLCANLDAL